MKEENKKCNALEHVPTCSTWPPRWMTAPAAVPPAEPARKDEPTSLAPAEIPLVHPVGATVATPPARVPPGFPANAEIVIVDENAYHPDDRRFKGAYMWAWIGGPAWYYVRDWPIPAHCAKRT